jgi:uncharacterized membrane protein YphA (DoxX/SURF4 family)
MKAFLKSKQTYIQLISSLLAALFVYTGLNKMMDYEVFKSQLGRSPFIEPFAGVISVTLPSFELAIAALLCIPRARLIGLYLSFGLMFFFTGYIYIMLKYAYDLPCSCGGALAALSWKDHLIFNISFTTLSAIAVLSYPVHAKSDFSTGIIAHT